MVPAPHPSPASSICKHWPTVLPHGTTGKHWKIMAKLSMASVTLVGLLIPGFLAPFAAAHATEASPNVLQETTVQAAPSEPTNSQPVADEDLAMNPTFSHELWDSVLQRFVDERGMVDYRGLAKDREELDRYLESIRTSGPKSTPELFPSQAHELAFYMNAYNALVFEGVIDLGPDVGTVWGWTGSGFGFFVMRSITVDGQRTNLKKLEDDIIRAEYEDPRIHAAINCASISCPRLPQEPFRAETLDQQLDAAMTEFVRMEPDYRRFPDERKVRVSKIFSWFEDDFLGYERREGAEKPTLTGYLNRYLPEDQQIPLSWTLEIADYDKGINRQ